MHKQEILARLATGEPFFTSLPTPAVKRICGTEIEFGMQERQSEERITDDPSLFGALTNGGEVYREQSGHLEYASPECADPLSATVYYEAGKRLCQLKARSLKLYCHNNSWLPDSEGSDMATFGAHESYFTNAPATRWEDLVPFLIARTVLCGAGWINRKGAFEISQRASHIDRATGLETMHSRPVINLRGESLASVNGWNRIHIICGDAGMSPMSTFLRIGTMSLAVEMLELGELPLLRYDLNKAGADIQGISRQVSGWYLGGLKDGSRNALHLLWRYAEKARALFEGRDSVTDILLAVWEDTVERLGKNPESLWRRLDWVAKKHLLDVFVESQPNTTAWNLRALDMEYHLLDEWSSLYFGLKPQMECLFEDKLVSIAMRKPPYNTRAHARGILACFLEKNCNDLVLYPNGWRYLQIVNRSSVPGGSRMPVGDAGVSTSHWTHFTPDPRETYTYALPEAIRLLEKRP